MSVNIYEFLSTTVNETWPIHDLWGLNENVVHCKSDFRTSSDPNWHSSHISQSDVSIDQEALDIRDFVDDIFIPTHQLGLYGDTLGWEDASPEIKFAPGMWNNTATELGPVGWIGGATWSQIGEFSHGFSGRVFIYF